MAAEFKLGSVREQLFNLNLNTRDATRPSLFLLTTLTRSKTSSMALMYGKEKDAEHELSESSIAH
jgi:hypothetical protein